MKKYSPGIEVAIADAVRATYGRYDFAESDLVWLIAHPSARLQLRTEIEEWKRRFYVESGGYNPTSREVSAELLSLLKRLRGEHVPFVVDDVETSL